MADGVKDGPGVSVSNGLGVGANVRLAVAVTLVVGEGVKVDSTTPMVARLVTVTTGGGRVGIWSGAIW